MARRRSVSTVLDTAAQAKAAGELHPDTPDSRTTGINLPADVHALLRAVAFKRAKEQGGRASVSAVLVELVRQNEKQLRREAGRYLDLIDLL